MSSESVLDATLKAKIEHSKQLLIEIARDYAPATFANSFGAEDMVADYAPATFANSFGAEDMVATDLICKFAPAIEIFSLDTGRLPQETHTVIQEAMAHYQREFTIYAPESSDVESYVRKNGPNAFYDSVELRKACCRIRKVLPLQRALKGKKAWVTGMRAEQSPTRAAGATKRCGLTSATSTCRITNCMTSTTPASAARPVPAPSRWGKIFVPGAGGGKILIIRNVGCTLRSSTAIMKRRL